MAASLRRKNTKTAIVEVAANLFRRRGFHETSMGDIAAAVGVSQPAVYLYFRSKQDLLREVIGRDQNEFIRNLRRETDSVNGWEKSLKTAVAIHTRLALGTDDPPRPRISREQLAQWLLPRDVGAVRHGEQRCHDQYAQILIGGNAAGTFQVKQLPTTVSAIWNMCEYSSRWFRTKGALVGKQLGQLHGQLALRMARGHTSRSSVVPTLDRPSSHNRSVHLGAKQRILFSAGRLFSERGFKGASLAQIGQDVGISSPGLYWYFDSKQDLLFEFLLSSAADFTAEVKACVETASHPRDRLCLLAYMHTRIRLERQLLTGVYDAAVYSGSQLAGAIKGPKRRQIQAIYKEYFRFAERIVEDGVSRGIFDVPHLAASVFAILNMCEYGNAWIGNASSTKTTVVAKANSQLAVQMVGWRERAD